VYAKRLARSETSFFIQCIVTNTLRLCIIVEIADVILNISQSLWNRIYIVTNASGKEVILLQELSVKNSMFDFHEFIQDDDNKCV